MVELQVIAKRHSNPIDKEIIHIKIADGVFETSRIMDWIDIGAYSFHVLVDEQKIPVTIETNPDNGKRFLACRIEGSDKNYLDDLPDC